MAAETLFSMIRTWAKQIRIAVEPEGHIPHSLVLTFTFSVSCHVQPKKIFSSVFIVPINELIIYNSIMYGRYFKLDTKVFYWMNIPIHYLSITWLFYSRSSSVVPCPVCLLSLCHTYFFFSCHLLSFIP